eukprot:1000136-Pyramimonas_sp.AAC.1
MLSSCVHRAEARLGLQSDESLIASGGSSSDSKAPCRASSASKGAALNNGSLFAVCAPARLARSCSPERGVPSSRVGRASSGASIYLWSSASVEH